MPKIDGSTLLQSLSLTWIAPHPDPLPIRGRGSFCFVPGELDDVGVGEETAVEVADDVGAELAALGHRFEQAFEAARQAGGIAARPGQDAGEELAFQQADVFGEHAEHQLHEEVGDAVGVGLVRLNLWCGRPACTVHRCRRDACTTKAGAQAVGEGGEAFGDFLGDVIGG